MASPRACSSGSSSRRRRPGKSTDTSLRTCADRRSFRAPSVAVGEELADDEDGGGEAERGVSVAGAPVGVAAELAVVRPPRVGRLDDPSQPEPDGLLAALAFGASTLDVEIVESELGELGPDDGVVVAAVELQGVDVGEQAAVGDVLQRGDQQLDVVAV